MTDTTEKKDFISLKWGTLKSWELHSDKAKILVEEYYKDRVSLCAATQHDTPRQKEIICELIDVCNADQIYLDWDDKWVSKEEAKKYVMEYGKSKDGAK